MTVRGELITGAVDRGQSHDLVVVVPGIMGSELTDTATGAKLWGLRDLGWYVKAWSTGSGLAALRLDEDERAGRYGRVTPSGLLRFPAYAIGFQGFEPYERLVEAARRAVVADAQIVRFAYDWRLPVAHNAGLLAETIATALDQWRADPSHDELRRLHPDERPAQVVIVAHSMGGLLARYLSRIPGATDDVRATITLGTPFYGSVKAAVLLNTGRGAPLPLPSRRPARHLFREDADEGVRALVRSLPGVHDLLPSYRCVNEGAPGRRLTESDAVGLGGDPGLVAGAWRLHRELAEVEPVAHRCMVGTSQPTAQSLTVVDGVVTTHEGLWTDGPGGAARWIDAGGDGTVYRNSASLRVPPDYLPQQHGPLARTDEAAAFVRGVITEQDPDRLGPPLAAAEIGVEVPDLALPGEEFGVRITGIDRPREAVVTFSDAGSGRVLEILKVERRDGRWIAPVTAGRPGLYRVEVAGGGWSPVRQLTLVTEPS
ncbi:hypothetical protein QLQ12_27420 [Actinoplanes sp. NEAU-A12]|uniref:Lecithin:cholesterol acyltransferase n=1 Tax=Actinoplanes sandaracinus TaxID=3045177 RepID=A0ABT6WRK0_9ACTN|nr:hypothetical protein [Actinoplanes sandaracinus]MDI6102354.1 hypothetical protein [Actinoplanes sandaracinus]